MPVRQGLKDAGQIVAGPGGQVGHQAGRARIVLDRERAQSVGERPVVTRPRKAPRAATMAAVSPVPGPARPAVRLTYPCRAMSKLWPRPQASRAPPGRTRRRRPGSAGTRRLRRAHGTAQRVREGCRGRRDRVDPLGWSRPVGRMTDRRRHAQTPEPAQELTPQHRTAHSRPVPRTASDGARRLEVDVTHDAERTRSPAPSLAQVRELRGWVSQQEAGVGRASPLARHASL